MSDENVEIVHRVFEAFKTGLPRGDTSANFDSGLVATDAEWVMPPGSPGFRDVYRGRDGFAEFMRTWTEDFDWEIELERVVDAGDDRVVGVFRQRATGKGSGVPVDLRMALLYELRDGQVTRMTNFLDPGDAFQAVGLSDDPQP